MIPAVEELSAKLRGMLTETGAFDMARSFRKTAIRFALAGGVCAAALAMADRTLPVVVDLAIPLGDGYSLSADRIFFSNGLIGSALAQSAGDVTIENIRVEGETGGFHIPNITFTGVNLSRDELTSIFSDEGDEPVWERLTRISAQTISAPEVTISYEIENASQELVYRDVTARGIVDGRIAEISSPSGSFDVEAEDESGQGSFGRTMINGLDLPHVVRFYTQAIEPGAANPHRTVYESFSVEDFRLTDSEQVEMVIGRMSGSDVQVRLLDRPFQSIIADLGALEGRDDLSREEAGTLMAFIVDIIDSVGFGDLEMTDIRMQNLEDDDVRITISRASMSSMAGGAFSSGTIEGIDIATPEGSARIDSMTSEGFSFAPMREAFRQIQANPDQQLDRASVRRLIPNLGTFKISGLASNFAMEETGEEVDFSLRELEVTATEPRGGVPTNVRFAFDDLAFDLPADTGEEGVERLRAMGYERLELSGAVATRWNEAANELVISEMSFSGVDMGSVSIRGVLGNMNENIFNPNQTVALMALMSGTVKSLHLMVENEGAIERALEIQARDMGTTPDALRMQFGMMATAMLPAMLGNSEQARSLSQAIGQFIANPGELEISATARNGQGIAFAEFLAISQPAALLEKIDLSATAR
jgi:hypothetical protein